MVPVLLTVHLDATALLPLETEFAVPSVSLPSCVVVVPLLTVPPVTRDLVAVIPTAATRVWKPPVVSVFPAIRETAPSWTLTPLVERAAPAVIDTKLAVTGTVPFAVRVLVATMVTDAAIDPAVAPRVAVAVRVVATLLLVTPAAGNVELAVMETTAN